MQGRLFLIASIVVKPLLIITKVIRGTSKAAPKARNNLIQKFKYSDMSVIKSTPSGVVDAKNPKIIGKMT